MLGKDAKNNAPVTLEVTLRTLYSVVTLIAALCLMQMLFSHKKKKIGLMPMRILFKFETSLRNIVTKQILQRRVVA